MSSLTIFPNGPSDNASIIMSGAWTNPCAYNDAIPPVLWPATPTTSFVRFVWTRDARVPATATHVWLRIKLKGYIPPGPTFSYCQGDARAYVPGVVSNHFIHFDEWSQPDPTAPNVGRRIPFAADYFPIINDQVTIDVAHAIRVSGDVEFVAYLEGYLVP